MSPQLLIQFHIVLYRPSQNPILSSTLVFHHAFKWLVVGQVPAQCCIPPNDPVSILKPFSVIFLGLYLQRCITTTSIWLSFLGPRELHWPNLVPKAEALRGTREEGSTPKIHFGSSSLCIGASQSGDEKTISIGMAGHSSVSDSVWQRENECRKSVSRGSFMRRRRMSVRSLSGFIVSQSLKIVL